MHQKEQQRAPIAHLLPPVTPVAYLIPCSLLQAVSFGAKSRSVDLACASLEIYPRFPFSQLWSMKRLRTVDAKREHYPAPAFRAGVVP